MNASEYWNGRLVINLPSVASLELVTTLVWIDGPLLSHFRAGNVDFVQVWIDTEEDPPVEGQANTTYHTFVAIAEVSHDDLMKYLKCEITLLDVERASPNIYVALEGETTGVRVSFDELDHSHRPQEGSYGTGLFDVDLLKEVYGVEPSSPGVAEEVL